MAFIHENIPSVCEFLGLILFCPYTAQTLPKSPSIYSSRLQHAQIVFKWLKYAALSLLRAKLIAEWHDMAQRMSAWGPRRYGGFWLTTTKHIDPGLWSQLSSCEIPFGSQMTALLTVQEGGGIYHFCTVHTACHRLRLCRDTRGHDERIC